MNSFRSGRIEPQSTASLLAERIKAEIEAGELLPGQPLRQEELSARFGVSRSPLREALRRLEAEGVVDYRPNVGATVAPIRTQLVREIFEMRRILEAAAIDLVIDRLDERALIKLRAQNAAIFKEPDLAAAVVAHGEFHLAVYALSGNPVIVEVLASYRLRTARFPKYKETTAKILRLSKGDHAELLRAVAARDRRAARKITLEHSQRIEELLLGGFTAAEER
jgi:DNA-binding GntR family transcriptional regulator